VFWSTSYVGAGWRRTEGAYGEALGRNSRGRGNHGGNADGRSLNPAGRHEGSRSHVAGSCPDDGRAANVRTLATSAVRVGVGMAVLLVVEMVHQLHGCSRISDLVRRLGWLGVGLMVKGLLH
jgi:hypothetical protein